MPPKSTKAAKKAAGSVTSSKKTPKTSKASAGSKTSKKVSKRASTKTARKTPAARRASSAKRLTPSKEKRGLDASQIRLGLDDAGVAPLVAEVDAAGGAALGAYREPLSGRPILLASLPLSAVEPTPFQRDLSPTHTKRLAQKIEESGSFLDPLIVVRGVDGRLWTPNGRHRLAAAKVLGLRQITALVSPDEDLAFKILALNTEKAHNLKDRSLEVIRMAEELAVRKPRAKESQFAVEFEAPELLTLGCVYKENGRFAGGAYSPLLKKVDRFSDRALPVSLRDRAGYASRLVEIDGLVKGIVDGLQDRGFKSPYLRNLVVARINPVRFHRAKKGEAAPPMALGAALTRMVASAKKFDLGSVRPGDLALVAAVASDDE
ncbi:MAG: ParB N-terminal domain-containing protein [Candidatus Eisenbacteria bacterium]|uniref:ParB N-terminal domain-containing protein n=1 Tax=Eiseniibacteriota bacterium TaxID=2212470 RepID=A0A956SFH7_UNCEI|nr:ParB N-terminal domain-containing protein [Candidatus Eisenbacteria bacterium]MCB9465832.1 ParB N-terminal domain-containing protein [Candidatus Eisenbacteria bacterium]